MASKYKPVGGVERVILYPADAVRTVLFSSNGCEVELSEPLLEVELLDDASHYKEKSECINGVVKIDHLLHIVADRKEAEKWLDSDFLEQVAIEGVVATVHLEDGRSLLVGYSSRFGNEQPLRLDSIVSSSGDKLHNRPTVALQLISHDTDFSCEII